MSVLKSKVLNKLHNRAGETIAETLVALLIAALALTMLAGAISASSNIVTKSKTTLDQYYKTNDKTVVRMREGSGSATLTLNVGTSITDSSYENISVTTYSNGTFNSDSPVIAYRKQE